MGIITSIYFAFGGIVTFFFACFAVTSIKEHKVRALILSGAIAIVAGVAWFTIPFMFSFPEPYLLLPCKVIVIAALLFFLPIGKTRRLKIGDITGRVDERDVMFAREEYHSGTEKYKTYYASHPELTEIDDKIRRLPELLAPGGKYYDPIRSRFTEAIFESIEGMLTKVDGEVNDAPVEPAAETMTKMVKDMARHLGACEVGIARLNPVFVYTNVGRGPEPWGAPIENTHAFAIAFTLEMDYDHVEAAPGIAITEESAREYLVGANISITLAQHIRNLGFPARAHIAGSNYQIMLPPVAHDAGLGELGRFGYLISPTLGARVRLGAVTTDLPLIPDKPIAFGVQDFCRICKRCAEHCPSAAIPKGEPTMVRGVEKWPLQIESCISYWRAIGTDCGLCMKVCPFSHPRSIVHDMVRFGIRKSKCARTLALWGEHLFYGRRLKYQGVR